MSFDHNTIRLAIEAEGYPDVAIGRYGHESTVRAYPDEVEVLIPQGLEPDEIDGVTLQDGIHTASFDRFEPAPDHPGFEYAVFRVSA